MSKLEKTTSTTNNSKQTKFSKFVKKPASMGTVKKNVQSHLSQLKTIFSIKDNLSFTATQLSTKNFKFDRDSANGR